MKNKLITVILTLVLAGSVAGVGWAAPPPLMETSQAGKSQVACPVLGGKINKTIYTDYQGQRIYFCCPACIDIFKQDPEKYLKKMEREGIVPEKIPGGN